MEKKAKKRERVDLTSSDDESSVLIVEDEEDLQDLLVYNLKQAGYHVHGTTTAEDALKLVRRDPPDLLLLDLMLPGMDGLELCRILKRDQATRTLPIIMLTAKGEESDVVRGLELGAEDYILKPFSPRVLMARIKAVLRRQSSAGQAEQETAIFRMGEMTVDSDRFEVRLSGKPLSLTPTEIGILQALSRRPGHVLTRNQIVKAVQGTNVAVTDRSVDVHVVALRRKLGQAGRYVKTVRGIGYRLEREA